MWVTIRITTDKGITITITTTVVGLGVVLVVMITLRTGRNVGVMNCILKM